MIKIKNYDDYYVTSTGKIYSLKNNKKRELKGWVQNTGYKIVALDNKKHSVHRLVAEAFIPNPNDYPVVNHIDGNKLNNNVKNLEWCTQKHNINEAIRMGLLKPKYNSNINKIRAKKIGQYDKQGNLLNIFNGSKEAETFLKNKKIKVNARNIRSVCEGYRKTAGSYIWRYI